jgi:phage virion morphogenesis protein
MITIEIKNDQVTPALSNLADLFGDLTPLMGRLAQQLQTSTLDRFPTGRAPDGSVWAPKSPVTLARNPGYTRPLIGRRGELSSTIGANWGADFAEISSARPQAAVLQFGAAQGAFGRTKRGGPIPWGNIPARPFFGISAQDETDILEIVAEWFQAAATGGA